MYLSISTALLYMYRLREESPGFGFIALQDMNGSRRRGMCIYLSISTALLYMYRLRLLAEESPGFGSVAP